MLTRLLGYASLVLMAIGVYGTFGLARPDRVQGDAARIVYFHVPMAWVAFLAFFVVFAASVAYLRTRAERWDRLGRASAEVGVVFTSLVLVTGAIWGYPIWGTWWSWDPKLTTTLIMWFLYLGYLMLRGYAEPPRGARYAAVLGIVGVLDIPILYVAVRLWRGIHPKVERMAPEMAWTLLVCTGAFLCLFAWLLWLRLRSLSLRDEIAALRRQALASS
jgi:heme exporter protein C